MIELIEQCQQLKILINNIEVAATFGSPLNEVPGINEFLDLSTDLDSLIDSILNPAPTPSSRR
jgi:hypothetical protein